MSKRKITDQDTKVWAGHIECSWTISRIPCPERAEWFVAGDPYCDEHARMIA